jgi:hypothetical protein
LADVVDDGLDLLGVEDAVLAPLHQIDHRDGRGDLMAKDPVELEDLAVLERLIDQVGSEDLLGDGLSHVSVSVE